MIVTIISIWVKEPFIERFIEATKDNHRHSVSEPGNLRFDVLRHQKEPNRFTLYEAYRTEQDVLDHKNTEHYRRWKTTVEEWMEKPREGVPHTVIAPEDPSLWK